METFNNSDQKTVGLSLGVLKKPSRHAEPVSASLRYRGVAGRTRNDKIVFIPLLVFAFFIAHIFATLLAADVTTAAKPESLMQVTNLQQEKPVDREQYAVVIEEKAYIHHLKKVTPLILPVGGRKCQYANLLCLWKRC